jgi:hypothetical protein
LYQVAVDLPGFGRSAHAAKARYAAGAVLADVVCSLGKTHAFAIVVYDRAAAALFRALLEDGELASFVVLRAPELESTDAEKLHSIFQPVLLLADPENAAKQSAMRQLRMSLINVHAPEINTRQKPEEYSRQAAEEMCRLFDMHHWKGTLGLGLSFSLPLLTRLAGGMKAWETDAPLAVTTSEEEEAKQATSTADRRHTHRHSMPPGKAAEYLADLEQQLAHSRPTEEVDRASCRSNEQT